MVVPKNSSSSIKFHIQSIKLLSKKLAVLDGICIARRQQQQCLLSRSIIREGERCLVHVRPETDIIFDDDDDTNNNDDVKGLYEQLVGAPPSLTVRSSSRWIEIDAVVIIGLSSRTIERNRKGLKLIEAIKVVHHHHGLDGDDDYENEDLLHNDDDDIVKEKDHRHKIFAKWLVETFGMDVLSAGTGVLDVAGGNGQLSQALIHDWGVPSILVDPNPRCNDNDDALRVVALPLHGDGSNLTNNKDDETTRNLVQNCSAIVGMHPDQATEAIVNTALRLKVPFATLPCCVMPSLFPQRRQKGSNDPVRSYSAFCQYLLDKAPEGMVFQTDTLPFVGRNKVIFGIP